MHRLRDPFAAFVDLFQFLRTEIPTVASCICPFKLNLRFYKHRFKVPIPLFINMKSLFFIKGE